MNTPTPKTDKAWSCFVGYTEPLQDVKDLSHELECELTAMTEQRDLIEGMYQKVIAAVLDCDPIPACKREHDQLEPPWEVITRIREQRDRLQLIVDEGCRVSSLCREYREQRDKMAEILRDILAYDKGEKPHDYWASSNHAQANAMAFDAWQEILHKIEQALETKP